ncbi:hypothetical protein HUJ04_006439 [Dendroctonus ponderosae]|uniref:Mediator of RNA polymerase II transcription subunit 15 n=1 Tax=Dendroctonus ponderosae TaxID=77166 RepID=A0AAR5QHQ4_DENPD|nr:hypothetical protein HUJ04_006439 [Dendroctonus ponderosae]KAH1012557.1 hypothetical protein HUJ05_011700 [Dendroctonus ponderosae]
MSLPPLWGSEKFRKSVINKLNSELEHCSLSAKNAGQGIENAVFEKTQSKKQYLGYVAKIILRVRNMGEEQVHSVFILLIDVLILVHIDDAWLANCVKTILSKPPPRLRRVLRPEEFAKYNKEMMKLRTQLQAEEILKTKDRK